MKSIQVVTRAITGENEIHLSMTLAKILCSIRSGKSINDEEM